MKYEIIIGILFELLSKKCVKAGYLAEKFEVSIRSIHRYINCLEMAGVPIYTIRGNQGGFAIVDTYRLPATFMTMREFEQVIQALHAISESVPNKSLNSAINKLKSVTKNEYSGFNLKSGNLIIDAGPWGDAVGYKSKLITLQKSIDECKKLSIKYHDRNGTITERIIEPHVIVFKQGIWYVYAFCYLRNDFRFFKTGRIESATILNQSFARRAYNEEDVPLNFWHQTVEAKDVIFEIEQTCLSDVEEWLGIENIEHRNGKHYAYAKLPYDNGLVTKIISFGSGIKVIQPEDLKEKVKACAHAIINNYK